MMCCQQGFCYSCQVSNPKKGLLEGHVVACWSCDVPTPRGWHCISFNVASCKIPCCTPVCSPWSQCIRTSMQNNAETLGMFAEFSCVAGAGICRRSWTCHLCCWLCWKCSESRYQDSAQHRRPCRTGTLWTDSVPCLTNSSFYCNAVG